MTSNDGQAEAVEHTREVPSAASHMDLAEHVTWMLGDVVEDVDYPMEVTVSIEVQSP